MHRFDASRRIENDVTLRIKRRKFEKTLSNPPVVFFPFAFHAIRRSPGTDSLLSGFVRQVQHEPQVGQESAGCDLGDASHGVKRKAAGETLIDEIREKVTVAEHRFTRLNRRAYHFLDHLRSCGHKQEHFRRCTDFEVFAAEQNFPDDVPQRRASRIAAKHRFDGAARQPVGKQFDLRTFSAAVAAVEGDEH